jgi:hypothetical protein
MSIVFSSGQRLLFVARTIECPTGANVDVRFAKPWADSSIAPFPSNRCYDTATKTNQCYQIWSNYDHAHHISDGEGALCGAPQGWLSRRVFSWGQVIIPLDQSSSTARNEKSLIRIKKLESNAVNRLVTNSGAIRSCAAEHLSSVSHRYRLTCLK